MYDFTHNQTTLHTAKAVGVVFCKTETVNQIRNNSLPQGSLFDAARAAGMLGAKAAPQLLPGHPHILIDGLQVEMELLQHGMYGYSPDDRGQERQGIVVTAGVKSIGRAGVAMEALAAVSAATLELYRQLSPLDDQLEIGSIRLLESKGAGNKKYFSTPPVCAVLVCSDSTAAGMREDNSGKLIVEMLGQEQANVKHYKVLPDNKDQIQQQLKEWVAEGIHYIFTTGGTGLGPRDNTVSAVAELLERDADGIAEAMRSYGQQRTPLAMMSRGVAGSIGETLVVTLPGSTAGARESLEAILPAVFHARKMMKGGGH